MDCKTLIETMRVNEDLRQYLWEVVDKYQSRLGQPNLPLNRELESYRGNKDIFNLACV